MSNKYIKFSIKELEWITGILSVYILEEMAKIKDPESIEAKRINKLSDILRFICAIKMK